jgi:hypothetical protein
VQNRGVPLNAATLQCITAQQVAYIPGAFILLSFFIILNLYYFHYFIDKFEYAIYADPPLQNTFTVSDLFLLFQCKLSICKGCTYTIFSYHFFRAVVDAVCACISSRSGAVTSFLSRAAAVRMALTQLCVVWMGVKLLRGKVGVPVSRAGLVGQGFPGCRKSSVDPALYGTSISWLMCFVLYTRK